MNYGVNVPQTLLQDKRLTSADKLVWMVMRLDEKEKNTKKLDSPTRLAKKTGLARFTIYRSLSRLTAAGWYAKPNTRVALASLAWANMPAKLLTNHELLPRDKVVYGLLQDPHFHFRYDGIITYLQLSKCVKMCVATVRQAVLALIKASSYNVEDYGIALAKGHGAGLSKEQFAKEIGNYNDLSSEEQKKLVESGEYIPSYMWNQNGWLCSRMGLTPISQTQKCIPTTHHSDLRSDTLGMVIKAGEPTGMSAIVTTETAEGITIETECIGNVYAPEDFDKNDWTFYGEPETTINVNRPATVELTCANLVNRIPALMNAQPGYVSTDKLPNNVYLVKPINEYVQ